jgi:hypothetical protein
MLCLKGLYKYWSHSAALPLLSITTCTIGVKGVSSAPLSPVTTGSNSNEHPEQCYLSLNPFFLKFPHKKMELTDSEEQLGLGKPARDK